MLLQTKAAKLEDFHRFFFVVNVSAHGLGAHRAGESPCRLVSHDYTRLLPPGRLHLALDWHLAGPGTDVRGKWTTKHDFATACPPGAYPMWD